MADGVDFESCAISATEILISSVVRTAGSLSYKCSEVILAAIAIRAINWGRTIISAIGWSMLQRMMARLRLSRFPKSDPRDLVSTLSLSLLGESEISPFDLECRRALIDCLSLSQYLPYPDWLPIIRHLEATWAPRNI